MTGSDKNEHALRVAVASKDGIAISEHFGHAKKFFIYRITKLSCEFLETREVRHYCLGGHSDKTALADILETIGDCAVVFVAKIGDGPKEKLKARGIESVSEFTWEEIEPSLLAYMETAQSGTRIEG